ncbi:MULTISPECIES: enoyl-CoA hydratase-related protein [unclassified Sedimentibacter]|uniref:enoyl-CoA hydratase-related protein n=1 Tax=unclassified Sedimentibacter TaxID=2649220 RepID=UPI0027DF3414|nr:enoyl-CoA hydratase-related protein [Sedimentibacter sp. MB35-C1]WMJ78789.1 enoyl-CoA hydratase-related protein [Sedimentibacter sp. MB35-C1]
MKIENLLVEKNEGVSTVRISSPKTMNALNSEMLAELEYIFNQLNEDDDTRVIVITGEGKAFVAGADIAYMSTMTPAQAKKFSEDGSRLFRKIEVLSKVVIAAVNGYALGGGCELAMACDIRIASRKAKFGQPEVGLGIIPGFSGTQRLSRMVGMGRAKELIYAGEHIDAEEAYRIGLVNKVTEKDNLMEETYKLANKIKSNSGIAVKYAKESINRGVETDIETGIAYETNIFSLCFAADDREEGIAAFMEKRKPNFK